MQAPTIFQNIATGPPDAAVVKDYVAGAPLNLDEPRHRATKTVL